ncbi:adenylate/guanylate cyclase domain-containing protein [Robiginitalea sp. SC105]|uniref:adenylate/guanylate cyclase domain-containing protein n=1 Tax=Robiginitalea sp. SC105 TaxID=2762332 RepID=UPI001639FA38|nr:adenylate/guanylate cyclase domain-containing protein [Robiginitalea sp. SC105]MBC2840088.1 tetratricopeptide repeat protein [Robiginitalea sp. SC105]
MHEEYTALFLEVALRFGSDSILESAFFERGNAVYIQGRYPESLEFYFKALELSQKLGNERDVAAAYSNIANAYSQMDNPANAVEYYQKSIEILKNGGDSIVLAASYNNLGDNYLKRNVLDSAAFYFEQSGRIYKALSYELGIGYYVGSLGIVNALKGEGDKAISQLKESISILNQENATYAVASFLPYLSDVYKSRGEYHLAIEAANQTLQIASKYQMRRPVRDAHLLLSELLELSGRTSEAFDHYKLYTKYKDSIQNLNQVNQMAKIRNDFEISQKQTEVDLLEKEATIQRLTERRQKILIYIIIGVLIVVFLIGFGLFRRYRYISRTNKIINEEKSRSDNLLKNILPSETAIELKQNGLVTPKKFDEITVLFTDFKGFSLISEGVSPEKLVHSVDYYFKQFDGIIEKHGLEKIKTIGDAYMCAGGIPSPNTSHAEDALNAAFEILQFVKITKINPPKDIIPFEIRIGLNTGPVVAGVVGTKKFAYDIWGSTVNFAARMESSSEPGRINVSENTYNLLKDKYQFTFRGEVEVKNGQVLKMYFAAA